MDLQVYARVLWRFRVVLAAGVVLGFVLALLSTYSVGLGNGRPTLTPRKKELWQSQATLLLTQPGFPVGYSDPGTAPSGAGAPSFADPSRFTQLASIYAKLAQGDPVLRLVKRSGPIEGRYWAVPTVDFTTGDGNPLPMVSVFAAADRPARAQEIAGRAMRAFMTYLENQQRAASIPSPERVDLQIVNAPQPAILVTTQKKTLPFVVFLAVVFAAVAFCFVLENVRPSIRLVTPEETEQRSDVRRLA